MTEKKKITDYIPIPAMIVLALGILAVGINAAYVLSPQFADWFNSNVSSILRMGMAYLTSWIPFSLAEYILMASPFLIAALIAGMIRYASSRDHGFSRAVFSLLAAIAGLYTVFTLNFGAGYRTTALDERMELESGEVSAEELYETMNIVTEKINELQYEVKYKTGTGSYMPYTHKDCVDLCSESYDKLAEEYSFIKSFRVPVKEIILSPFMTYTHISGVYTFFTGEANLNTNYPDYVRVFTTAHEMAHQRGIARENEANFIAYLVCINSEDSYMQYCGYLNMYEYLADALYSTSPKLYAKASSKLEAGGRYDIACFSSFFEKYRNNVAADVSGAVNDKYLESQGTEGEKSYGLVVDLAVAYHKSEQE